MSRIIYVNGRYVPEKDAFIPLMDRSFLFGDGIYEVSAVINGKLIDNEAHLVRLNRSLNEIEIPNPHSNDEWLKNQQELIARNNLKEGIVYSQVSRGAFEREFTSPVDLQPTIVMFTQEKNILEMPLAKTGAKVITVPDQRWERRDIKSTSLLAQVLAKRAAQKAGADEAWMVEDSFITEGASSTAFIITKTQEIITRPLSNAVLPGITRQSVMRLAHEQGLKVVERPFSVVEALTALEAFYTSASSFVMPVTVIDGQAIGSGKIGALSMRLREIYLQMALGHDCK
jgi:D-alanine transaminase